MNDAARLKDILQKHQQNVTKPRLAVFETLVAAGEPLRPGEIARRTPAIDRSSTYRTLDIFERLGVTVALTRGWHTYIELAAPFSPHHHHFMCRQCETVIDFESPAIEKALAGLAKSQKFVIEQHSIELSGLCARCSPQH